MFAVAIGLLIVVAIAVIILAVVALPNLRNGSRVLTPGGERALEQARQKPVAAAGQTVRGVRSFRRVASRAWAPASGRLHELMDRLETREGPSGELRTGEIAIRDLAVPESAPEGAPETARVRHSSEPEPEPQPVAVEPEPKPEAEPKPPIRHAQPSGPLRQKFDVAAIVGKRGPIGRPRPVPPISGPIPVDKDSDKAEKAEKTDQVIDLRDEVTEHETDTTAARHAR